MRNGGPDSSSSSSSFQFRLIELLHPVQTHTRRLHPLRVVNKHVDLFIMILFFPHQPLCVCVLAAGGREKKSAGRPDDRDGMREKVKLTPSAHLQLGA